MTAYGFPPFADVRPQLRIGADDYPAMRARRPSCCDGQSRCAQIWRVRVQGHEWAEVLPTLIDQGRPRPLAIGVDEQQTLLTPLPSSPWRVGRASAGRPNPIDHALHAGAHGEYAIEQHQRPAFPTSTGDPLRPPREPAARGHAATVVIINVVFIAAIVVAPARIRLWNPRCLGFNSARRCNAGQAAAIAAGPELREIFPIFPPHPRALPVVLAGGRPRRDRGTAARPIAAVTGMLAVAVVFLLGRLLYGTRAGLLAALFMALMPYHVLVSRQILLDGPMTLFATLALYLVARFARSGQPDWLYAAGAALG